MNILVWHVHGSWTTAFVQGPHTYLLPVVPDRGPNGRGRARTWDWPLNAVEVPVHELADTAIDVVVVQRPSELVLCEQWLGGRRPGRDMPLVWVEHDAPQGRIDELHHPAADRHDAVLVHVTATNDLLWDAGSTRTTVIEHGVIDPGERWTGESRTVAVAINEPLRRGRVTGTDLLPRFGEVGTVQVMGMRADALQEQWGGPLWLQTCDDLDQEQLHAEMARCRCYLHPYRWTSLGLSLIEAMMLGMPVVAVGTLAVPDAVPAGCGVVSNDVGELVAAVDRLLDDPVAGAEMGAAARRAALERWNVDRFVADWNHLLEEL
ncbi:MAG: glycosyltransferase [Actinomycetota bacterium]|nr:glycosyltransferase [Actinomycetota bacterium]